MCGPPQNLPFFPYPPLFRFVPAVEAGLPPVQDGLSGGVVVDDLRRAVVTPVAVVGIEGARGREKLLEEPPVDRWAEAPAHGLPARVFLGELLRRIGDLAKGDWRFLGIESYLFEGVLVVVEDRRRRVERHALQLVLVFVVVDDRGL